MKKARSLSAEKPIWKKWWFWVAVVLGLCLIGSFGNGGQQASDQKQTHQGESQEQSVGAENEPAQSESQFDAIEATSPATAQSYEMYSGTYEVFRADFQRGITGDQVGYSPEEVGMEGDYIVLGDDGSMNFSINGVDLNTSYSFGSETTVSYSGQSGYDALQLDLEQENVGTVNVEAYIVDEAPYIVMYTKDDDGFIEMSAYFLKME